MLQNSQKDKLWAKLPLGDSKVDTIESGGCKVTSLGNLLGLTPIEIDKLLMKGDGYVEGCLIEDRLAARVLGLDYLGKANVTNAPQGIWVAETDAWQFAGSPQHFFLYNTATAQVLDPLDVSPKWKYNPYAIKSLRLFKISTRNSNVTVWAKQAVEKMANKGYAKDWSNPQESVTPAMLEQILFNMGAIKQVLGGITKERFAVALDNLKLL